MKGPLLQGDPGEGPAGSECGADAPGTGDGGARRPAPPWLMARVRGMAYVTLLAGELGSEAVGLLTLSGLSGLANGAIVAVINAAAVNREGGDSQTGILVLFGLAIFAFLWMRQRVLLRCGERIEGAVRRLRTDLADRIRHSEFAALERLETSGVYVTLTECTTTMSQAALPVINALGAAVMVLFCMGYLYYLSGAAFVITIALLVTGVMQFARVQRKVEASLGAAMRTEAGFFAAVRHLLDGIKEVKLNARRGDAIVAERIQPLARGAAASRVRANRYYVTNWNFVKILSYLLVAAMVFLLPLFNERVREHLVELVTVSLFMFAPVGDLVDAMPLLARANTAVRRLADLQRNLRPAPCAAAAADSVRRMEAAVPFETLELSSAGYSHRSPEGEVLFTVGPVDLTVARGETVFFVGGNGSGKSTFLRMVTGLYPAGDGRLRLNGVAVDEANLAAYQAHFSAVFADFHLFDRLYGLEDASPERVAELLRTMRIDHKTAVRDGAFTQLNLSTGQRKRIALVVSLLEDRPILVFDEVAADQDPGFREYFYAGLLPELKAGGKTLLVVSHDDRYFGYADRVYKMDYGRLSPL